MTAFRPTRNLLALLLLALAASLAGCSNADERDARSSVDELYERGVKAMNSGNFRNAIRYFEGLEARYPFSNQAKQAQLNLIYSYYKNNEPISAIDAATQFERENPTHPRVDYAIYMRGLAQFHGQRNFFHKLMRIDLAMRPPVDARESFSAFSQLIKRYPNSPYAADAEQRMVFLRNRLADHENHVAQYYLDRGAYIAALNRADYSLRTYDGAPGVAKSMNIMVQAYEKLGMRDLADVTRRVLEENYPGQSAPPPKDDKKFLFF